MLLLSYNNMRSINIAIKVFAQQFEIVTVQYVYILSCILLFLCDGQG